MRHPHKAGDRAILNKIDERIKEAVKILEQLGYEIEPISSKEFYDYMTGETPTGDVITLNDILDNEFLMVHEVVEISELKKKGKAINKQTVMNSYPKTTYETHFTATEYELTYASNKKDYAWLKIRMNHARDWLSDKNLPKELLPQYKSMVKRFSKHLSNV